MIVLYFRSIPPIRIIKKIEYITMGTPTISKITDSKNKLITIDFFKDMFFSIHKIINMLIITININVENLYMIEIVKNLNLFSFFTILHQYLY